MYSRQAIKRGLDGDIQHWSEGLAGMYANAAAYLGLTLRPAARPIAYRPYKDHKAAALYIAECHTLLGDLRRDPQRTPVLTPIKKAGELQFAGPASLLSVF
jgi:hypothetical protein